MTGAKGGGEAQNTGPVYLDYQATTPLAPEAWAAMEPWLRDKFANPHSAHKLGREAKATVEVARDTVGALMPEGGRLLFTSGATEALNLALLGSLPPATGARRRIVTIATEHSAVLDTVHYAQSLGYELTILPVGRDGLVDMNSARAAIDDTVALVAVMLVNNEIGVIQPVADIAAMARDAGALFLCDAVQGYGRVPLPQAADMIAISAHKIHGPKGIGALWVRDGVEVRPILHGGGQEEGLRSGTLSPALCAGFGAAASVARERETEDRAHINRLWAIACERMAGWTINGSAEHRYHGNLNLRRDGIDAARLMADMRDVAFSLGSACASGSGRPSHVLAALGLSSAEAKSSIRLGWGRYTDADDLAMALDGINAAAAQQAA